jgi:hypothetical protein
VARTRQVPQLQKVRGSLNDASASQQGFSSGVQVG